LSEIGADNAPGGRQGATIWTDSKAHVWLFGGQGIDSNLNSGYLNDLWEFNLQTNEWKWVSGSNAMSSLPYGPGEPGVYGTLGKPSSGSVPGGRSEATGWTDASGHLWLFGGQGCDAASNCLGALNDLWEFDPSTNEWAWMGGSSTVGSNGGRAGVYGPSGTFAAKNIPGGRYGATFGSDSKGNHWLFGGSGFDVNGRVGYLNDLWEFNAATKEWAWMSGSSKVGKSCNQYGTDCGQTGVYGVLGKPGAKNVPGGRANDTSWVDSSGSLWLFGGYGYDAQGKLGVLDDLWQYQLSLPDAKHSSSVVARTDESPRP
jgi:N-acetylneuraminic acid mutarotase